MARKMKGVTEVDMSDVPEGGGGQFHIPPGPYRVKCVAVQETTSSNDNPMLKWEFVGVEGKSKGKRFYYYTVLTTDQLWKVRQTLVGLGIEVPESRIQIVHADMIDCEGIAIVGDEEYNDETVSKIQRFAEPDEEESDDEEEDAPAKTATARKKAAAEAEEEDDEEEATPKKVAAKGNGKKKAAVKYSEDEVGEMDEDELTALVEKCELDVDLDTFKTMKRKRAGVVVELKERDLLEA